MLSLDGAGNLQVINLVAGGLPQRNWTALFKLHMEVEFSFASVMPPNTLLPSPQTSNQLQTFCRLNEAHPSYNFDSFLGWRRKGGSAGVR